MRHLIAPATLLLALTLPAAVQASPEDVMHDCGTDGVLDDEHSNADKQAALKQLTTELEEYSDCRSVIKSSIGAGGAKERASNKKRGDGGGAAGSSSGGGGDGSIDADTNGDGEVTSAEKAAAGKTDLALKQDEKRKDTEGTLGDRKTDPTRVGASETSNSMSAPVIASIVALALLAAVAGLFFLARRNPGFAQAMRRIPLPSFLRR